MVSTTMYADEIPVRVRAADTSSTLTVPRTISTRRRSGAIKVEGDRVHFDLGAGVKRTAYLSLPGRWAGEAPGPLIQLHRQGIVGVLADWQSLGDGDAKVLAQFSAGDSVLASREVRPAGGRPSWFAPPLGADGLGLALVFEGTGIFDIGLLEVVTPPPRGWMPTGKALVDSLGLARFPHDATSWIVDPETALLGPRRVRIGRTELSLVPPIDWHAGPEKDRTFQLALHGFSFADTVLGSEESEPPLWMADVFEDWVDTHPPHPHSTTEMAWNDMSVASRTVALLRVIELLQSREPARAASLAVMAAEHARWLAHDRNYLPGHDHGLFSDTALEYAARVLQTHTLAQRWRTRARERMTSTLGAVVCESEGSVLEHSPAYIEKVAALFAHRRRNGLRDALASDLNDRLEETLSIVTTPNRRLLPWGDTGHDHVSTRQRPIGVFGLTETGWGISHLETGTVGLSAGFHSSAHKHGDDLSVVFYDSDGPVVTEAGFPGYGYRDDDFRALGTSERAHNTVIINDEVADWRAGESYGAALWHASALDDWHLLGGWNPLQSAGSHLRFVLHGPDLVLIADLLTGPDIRSVERVFHFDERLVFRASGDSGVDFEGWSVSNWSEARSTRISVSNSGTETLHFPKPGIAANHYTVALVDEGPGLRMTGVAHPEAEIDIEGGSVRGTSSQIRVALKLAKGQVVGWTLTDPWEKDLGRLELESSAAF